MRHAQVSCLMMMLASHSQESPTHNVLLASKCECRHAPKPSVIPYDDASITFTGTTHTHVSSASKCECRHAPKPSVIPYDDASITFTGTTHTHVSSASKCECRHAPQPNLILHDAGIANLYSSATIQQIFLFTKQQTCDTCLPLCAAIFLRCKFLFLVCLSW